MRGASRARNLTHGVTRRPKTLLESESRRVLGRAPAVGGRRAPSGRRLFDRLELTQGEIFMLDPHPAAVHVHCDRAPHGFEVLPKIRPEAAEARVFRMVAKHDRPAVARPAAPLNPVDPASDRVTSPL